MTVLSKCGKWNQNLIRWVFALTQEKRYMLCINQRNLESNIVNPYKLTFKSWKQKSQNC